MSHILSSEAISFGVGKGLTVKAATEALRLAIDNISFAIWARRHEIVELSDEAVRLDNLGLLPPADRTQQVELQIVPFSAFPEVDDDGFAAVCDEHGAIRVATAWTQDFLVFRESNAGVGRFVRLWDVRFDDLQARRVITNEARKALARSGRRPIVNYQDCRDAVLAQILASPANFVSEGRVVQNSDRPQQMSVVGAARNWCGQHILDREPPSDDTLRRQVALPLEPILRAKGLRTWTHD